VISKDADSAKVSAKRIHLERTMRSAGSKVVGFIAALLLLFGVACGGKGTASSKPTPAPTPVVAISLTPGSAALSINGTKQFAAKVTGSTNTGVTWTVAEAVGGSVNSAGLYTAPAKAGTFHVVATSAADTTKSAKSAVTVAAPLPTFSSAAPAAAIQATTYSYTIQAVDPAGTSLTYALTAAPAGATVSGNTVTWTPAANQSRVPNSFTLTATSAAGATSSQSWTVIPTGTVTGTCNDTFYAAKGSVPSVNDLSQDGETFAALVPQADGSVQTINGTGTANGTFTITNVPAGYYWLQLNFQGLAYVGSNQYFWTSSSTFDCGADGFGRYTPSVDPAGVSATLNWYLTDLVPWVTSGNNLDTYNPNIDYSFGPDFDVIPSLATTFVEVGQNLKSMPQVDPTQGDLGYVVQSMDNEYGEGVEIWSVVSTAALPNSFSIVNQGDIGNINALMVPNSSSLAMDINIDFPSYATAESVNSAYVLGGYNGFAQIQPFVADRWTPNWDNVELNFFRSRVAAPSTLLDLGSYNLGTQYPSTWPVTFWFDLEGISTTQLAEGDGSTKVQVPVSIGQMGTTLPTALQPAEPAMSPIQNATINNVSFSSSQAINGGAITLAWSAPTGLAPCGYMVDLYQVDPEGGKLNPDSYLQFYTAQPTMIFPAQSLGSGTYLFVVEAMADSLAKIETAPFHYGLTAAWADAASGVITYTYTGTSATPPTFFPSVEGIGIPIKNVATNAKANAAARKGSPRSKHALKPGFAGLRSQAVVAK
jgi:carbon monoxide dehydrogenase subunit G